VLGIVTRSLLVAVAAVAFVGGAAGTGRAGPATAFVRVNQVGYPSGASKRAYLLSSAPETGAVFRVKDAGGATVFKAPVGDSLGSWNDAYPYVYPLDFDAVTGPGTDTIAVGGPVPAASPSFRPFRVLIGPMS